MGADNWASCPQCKVNREKATAKRVKEIENSYGKVSIDEFERMREDLRIENHEHEATLREDYELGIGESGKFYVIYSGFCSECKFSVKFRHEEQQKLK